MAAWHDVTTNAEGRVIGLELDGNRLAGIISPQMGDLDALEQLSLRMNRLDDIPRELGKVHTLKELNLSWNIGVEGVQLLMGKLRRDVASEFVIEQVKRLVGVQLAKLRRLAKLWRDVASKAVHPLAWLLQGIQVAGLWGYDACEAVSIEFQADHPALRDGGNTLPCGHRLRRPTAIFTPPAILMYHLCASQSRSCCLPCFGIVRSVEQHTQNLAITSPTTCFSLPDCHFSCAPRLPPFLSLIHI